MRRGISSWIAAAAFLSSSLAQPLAAQGVAGLPLGVLPGDDKLTCPQILAEGRLREREQDLLREAADKIQVNPSAQTQALQALSTGLGMLFSALPGPLAGLAGSTGYKASMESFSRDSRRAYADIEARQEFALERMSLMHGLYQRKCTGGLRDIATATPAPIPVPNGMSKQMNALMKVPEVAQPGDPQLTCVQLNAEVAALDKQIEANREDGLRTGMAQAQRQANRMQTQGMIQNTIGGLASAIPGVGAVAGAAAKVAGAAAEMAHDPVQANLNAMKSVTEKQAYATTRMQHVRGLYMDKCLGGTGGK